MKRFKRLYLFVFMFGSYACMLIYQNDISAFLICAFSTAYFWEKLWDDLHAK